MVSNYTLALQLRQNQLQHYSQDQLTEDQECPDPLARGLRIPETD